MSTDDFRVGLQAYMELSRYAEGVLGSRGWRLLCSYGRVMTGAYGGLYVSGIPVPIARAFVDALAGGEDIDVHLMHRHVSGKYETSQTRLQDGQLWMLFDDRTELA